MGCVVHLMVCVVRGLSPSKCLDIRVILLLLSIRVFKRGSFGKPSRMMTLLSDRSMLSN